MRGRSQAIVPAWDSTVTGGVAAEGGLDGDGEGDGERRAAVRTTGRKELRRMARCWEGGATPQGGRSCGARLPQLTAAEGEPQAAGDGTAGGVAASLTVRP
jgi:hypothetical protein